MAGEYRSEAVLALLPSEMADAIRAGLRIGFANKPMTGVQVRLDLAADMANAYEAAGQQHYADGLRDGTMVPLIPLYGSRSGPDRYWAPGELFFSS